MHDALDDARGKTPSRVHEEPLRISDARGRNAKAGMVHPAGGGFPRLSNGALERRGIGLRAGSVGYLTASNPFM